MKWKALAAAVMLVVAGVGPAAAAATTQSGSAYAGTYVEFDTSNNAVVDYTVNGETLVDGVAVQSKEQAESSGSVSGSLSGDASFEGAGVSLEATTRTQATLGAESGAEMHAHDNDRGVLVVEAGGTSQYVRANLTSTTEAEQESDSRVVVTEDDGTQGAFLVVGEGSVTVSEDGDVNAELGEDGKLVYRQYQGERSDSDEQQEQLITNGTAAAEVYFQQAQSSGEDSANDGQQYAVDVVKYSEDTTVEVTERSKGSLEMTVERSQSEGKVVITSLSEKAYGTAEDLQVTVDGEAAAEASSYSEVKSATNGGDTSKFLVQSSSSAQASTDVVLGINHFSERQVSMQSEDGGSESGGSDATPTEGNGPGFGALGALAALGAALLARQRL